MPGSSIWPSGSIPGSPAASGSGCSLPGCWRRSGRPLSDRAGEQPRLLLLDEPTSALDLKYQHQLLTMARALASRNTAVLVVLHDLNLAARYADRLVMLERGKLMADGTPAEVLTPELIARLYDYPAQVLHHPESGLPMVV